MKPEEPTATPVPPVTPYTPTEPLPVFDPKDIEDNKFVAALSYIYVFFLVPLLMKRESPFAQFHARQGLVFALAFTVGGLLFWIPFFGQLLFIIVLVANVYALIQAMQGKVWRPPFVGDIVKKLNI